MWEELEISGGTAIIILIAMYFVVKWAVKNGVKEAYTDITGKKTAENIGYYSQPILITKRYSI